MGISPHESPPAVVETVEEIMRIIKSLPTRPTIDEVDAALSVLKGVEIEEETKLAEIDKFQKPLDVPEELFLVLQEVKKNMVLFQSQEQKREALYVIELDERFQGFDELIQRASKVVCGDTQISKDGDFDDLEMKIEKNSYISDVSLVKKKKELNREAGVLGGLPRSSSLKAGLSAGGGEEKLSLMKVAGLIETYAKKGVEVLDLQGKLKDQVEWLPQSLGKLFDVTDLNLSENRLLALPSTINDLQYLRRLDLHSNQLINLPDTFGELSNLIDLDLHGNRLRSLPASIGNLSKLASLDLSSNALSNLPESVGNLTSLKRLNVQTNELEELPYTIGSCTSLIELRLDFNQLKALPEAIGKLGNLEIVSLHYNRIKGLPTTMGSLSKLKELDVTFNELESVPENLCFATSLVRLNVGSNFADLKSLPRSIGNLEMLEEFDISNNQIRVLPLSFRFLSKLRVFNADETPLEIPPREVVKLGAQAAVQYMADLVVKTEEGPPQAVEKKGFWIWLFSLFQTRRKAHQKRIGSIKT